MGRSFNESCFGGVNGEQPEGKFGNATATKTAPSVWLAGGGDGGIALEWRVVRACHRGDATCPAAEAANHGGDCGVVTAK